MQSLDIDSALCINVLEHIADDKQALSNIIAGVAPGGFIGILVPAFSWLYGTLDSLDGHFRRYSKKMLLALLAQEPVRLTTCYYFNFMGMLGWYIKGKILKQKIQKDENYAAMNWLLPLVRPLEKIIHPPAGLSLIAIVQKNR